MKLSKKEIAQILQEFKFDPTDPVVKIWLEVAQTNYLHTEMMCELRKPEPDYVKMAKLLVVAYAQERLLRRNISSTKQAGSGDSKGDH